MKTKRNWLEDKEKPAHGDTDRRTNRHKEKNEEKQAPGETATRRKRHQEKLAHDISLNSEKLFLTQNVMIMMPPVLSS